MTLHKINAMNRSGEIHSNTRSCFVYGVEEKSSKVFIHPFLPIRGGSSMVGGVHRTSSFDPLSTPFYSKLNLRRK